jgi:predicted glycosyltransferase involved in capsule biosynthesis
MKYSIVITYRDRRVHLDYLLPKLIEKFDGKDYEIVIVEQDDDAKFKKNSLYNIATEHHTTGDVIIFHDVDHYPTDEVEYEIKNQPVYPVRRVFFVDEKWKHLPDEKIPGGYRQFKIDTAPLDHSGGVFILTREMWNKIGGFNPMYIGWGKEDDDTRSRLRAYGYEWYRNEKSVGTFIALPHDDNHPEFEDSDFINNCKMLTEFNKYLHYGHANVSGDVEVCELHEYDNVKWLKVNNFKMI